MSSAPWPPPWWTLSTATGLGHAARAAIELGGVLADLQPRRLAAARRRLTRARELVELAPHDTLAAYDEHLHVMLLLIESYWAALHGDAPGHRGAVDAAIALADADGRPFPRSVARTLGAARRRLPRRPRRLPGGRPATPSR